MTKEWYQKCKDCGIEFGYSDYALQSDLKKGFRRPERCKDCRDTHSKETQSIASSHFGLIPHKGKRSILGLPYLGHVEHGDRKLKDREKDIEPSGIYLFSFSEIVDDKEQQEKLLKYLQTIDNELSYSIENAKYLLDDKRIRIANDGNTLATLEIENGLCYLKLGGRKIKIGVVIHEDDKLNIYSGMDIGMTPEHMRRIYEALEEHQVLVIVAPTGTGKSTYIPFRLVDPLEGYEKDKFTKHGPIVVTQPRIPAASGIPRAIGDKLMGSHVGPGFEIGYRSRTN
jgi:hypothetical protein